MSDVFISYSRKDIDFVQRGFDVLTSRDRDPWVNWQDIRGIRLVSVTKTMVTFFQNLKI